jgi:hypothetical protein
MRVSANSSSQRARARGGVAGTERGLGVAVVQVLADDGGIRERHVAVDQHRDAPERAQRREAFVAEERHDRVDLVREALEPEADEDLPDVGGYVVADDAHGRRSTGAGEPSQ